MSPRSKKEYVETIFLRYKQGTRKQKNLILNEFCATLGYHRKHAIRLLRKYKRFQKPKTKKRGRTPIYAQPSILKPLKKIWLAANLPCSKRLKALLPLWLPGYVKSFGNLSPEASQALLQISPATIDRILHPIRIHYKKRGRATTKPGTLLRNQIPIKTNQWNKSRLGFLEADTVAHCGTSLLGMFAYTLDCTDIATGWTEQRAVWGKGETGVLEQIHNIEQSLPFPLLGFDSDNGGEFLNHHLFRHFANQKQPIQFTRSRAYHNQDNAHVEKKTGLMSANGSATTASITPKPSPSSMPYTPKNGDSSITSSAPLSNSLKKNASAPKPANTMTHQKPLTSVSSNLPTSHSILNKPSQINLNPSTPSC